MARRNARMSLLRGVEHVASPQTAAGLDNCRPPSRLSPRPERANETDDRRDTPSCEREWEPNCGHVGERERDQKREKERESERKTERNEKKLSLSGDCGKKAPLRSVHSSLRCRTAKLLTPSKPTLCSGVDGVANSQARSNPPNFVRFLEDFLKIVHSRTNLQKQQTNKSPNPTIQLVHAKQKNYFFFLDFSSDKINFLNFWIIS